jgi:alkyl hydroperoxide reductase subunit AhpF
MPATKASAQAAVHAQPGNLEIIGFILALLNLGSSPKVTNPPVRRLRALPGKYEIEWFWALDRVEEDNQGTWVD